MSKEILELSEKEKRQWKNYQRRNKFSEYCNYRTNQLTNKLLKKSYTPKYKTIGGKKVLSFEETNKMIADAIAVGKPFWAGRYGMTEMQMMVQRINCQVGLQDDMEKVFGALCNGAGFFPNDIQYTDRFVELMLEACSNIDLHAAWPMNMEDYFIKYYETSVKAVTRLGWLEPWSLYRFDNFDKNTVVWSNALKGKRVLVIHPFAETIAYQYQNHREQIFEKLELVHEVLPEFELKTLKSVQTIAGATDDRFQTWFEALDYMAQMCKETKFDVAIIGCGAYGFPLANEIKKMGKIAIHLGGATQLLFGIMGKRWENEGFKKLHERVVNDSWTRPNKQEKPKGFNKIENGCYW